MSIPDSKAVRRDTINRAIALIDVATPADLADWLRQINVRDSLRDNPADLRAHLADSLDEDFLFPAWKVSQQLLEAAGLPY